MITNESDKPVISDQREGQPWHTLDVEEVLDRLGAAEGGLTSEQAARRLAEYGPNELIDRGIKSPWLILWEQLTGIMVLILIIAAAISAFLGDYEDAIAIMAIVVLNALLGFTQEYRAEKAMSALRKLAAPIVKVKRDGHIYEISGRELVPGDIVYLEAGNYVPADLRLREAINLRIQEAALTGESEPVEKSTPPLPRADLPLGDRHNMAYSGTIVTYGRGQAIVTATGMNTQLGQIATMIQTVEREPTPLQRRLGQLARGLAIAAVGIVTVVFVLGLLRGEDWKLMFLTAISMAVAAVPEGLPAVVTITLALGAQRMLKRNALIRKLPAVETLGSVTTICSDKTGTLTENRMTVTVLDIANHRLDLTAQLERTGAVTLSVTERRQELSTHPALALLLAGGALCNDAVLEVDDEEQLSFRSVGDPTEGALVVAAARFGLRKDELENALPRVAELPFESERKRMTTVHHMRHDGARLPVSLKFVKQLEAPYLAITKGAVDGLLNISRSVWSEDEVEPMTEEWRKRIAAANDYLAQGGMRVLGVAVRPLNEAQFDAQGEIPEEGLIFVGIVGMIDPPRSEVREAIQTCRTAGIRPVMITGDHPLTARAVADELGLNRNGEILMGVELDRLSDDKLGQIMERVDVYARVSPEHKLRIVQALQRGGQIAAMTGDGINDAPALKKADIGVAMGITGTDVTKEAADMVLLDDNFATIVAAVREGRTIYDNIRKFIKYTMTSNSGEIWAMLIGPFLGMPLPLLPLQILWVNLVTDGLPGLALGVEPAERGTMRRPPYHPNENIFGRGMSRHIILFGLLMGLVSLGMGYWYWSTGNPDWQTMVFTTLTLSQMGHALAIRSGRDSLFSIGLLSNSFLLGAVLLTLVLQLAVVYVPFLQDVFSTVALPPADLAVALALSTVVFWGVELEKWLQRRSKR